MYLKFKNHFNKNAKEESFYIQHGTTLSMRKLYSSLLVESRIAT